MIEIVVKIEIEDILKIKSSLIEEKTNKIKTAAEFMVDAIIKTINPEELISKEDLEEKPGDLNTKKKPTKMKVCKACGKEFLPIANHQDYCTVDCKVYSRNQRLKKKTNKVDPNLIHPGTGRKLDEIGIS